MFFQKWHVSNSLCVWQEIRFVQLELEELSMQAELESLCSAVECMIQTDYTVQLEHDRSCWDESKYHQISETISGC